MRKNRRDPGIWKKNYRRTWERQGKKRERERERKLVSFRIFKCKVDMESLNPAYTYYILRILCSFVQLYNGWKLSIWSVHGTAADWNLPLTNSCISHERHHCTVLGPRLGPPMAIPRSATRKEAPSAYSTIYMLTMKWWIQNCWLRMGYAIRIMYCTHVQLCQGADPKFWACESFAKMSVSHTKCMCSPSKPSWHREKSAPFTNVYVE